MIPDLPIIFHIVGKTRSFSFPSIYVNYIVCSRNLCLIIRCSAGWVLEPISFEIFDLNRTAKQQSHEGVCIGCTSRRVAFRRNARSTPRRAVRSDALSRTIRRRLPWPAGVYALDFYPTTVQMRPCFKPLPVFMSYCDYLLQDEYSFPQ